MNHKTHEALRLSNEESNKITKESLKTAFLLLVSQEDIDKISITRLTSKAGVSRTAFYRNYRTIYDISAEIGNDINERFHNAINSDEYKNNSFSWFLNAFKTVAEHPELARVLESRSVVDEILFDNKFADLLSKKNGENKYVNIAAETAFYKVIIVWYRSGMKESPEEMAKICNGFYDKIFNNTGEQL